MEGGQQLIYQEVWEDNGNYGDVVVLENNYKGDIKYQDLGQSSGVEDIVGGGYIGGAGEEIRRWLWQQLKQEGGGDGRSV